MPIKSRFGIILVSLTGLSQVGAATVTSERSDSKSDTRSKDGTDLATAARKRPHSTEPIDLRTRAAPANEPATLGPGILETADRVGKPATTSTLPGPGSGACCQNNGVCTDVADEGSCPGGNFYPGASCRSAQNPEGFLCNQADSCDYDHDPPSSVGFSSQVFPDLLIHVEAADNFTLKGTQDNDCLVEKISFLTFGYNYDSAGGCPMGGGANCMDNPTDYDGIVVTIMSDIDGSGPAKRPFCEPKIPVTGGPPFHVGLNPACPAPLYRRTTPLADCCEFVFGTTVTPNPPPSSGDYWTYVDAGGGQPAYRLTLHFDPPLRLVKNAKHWLAIAVVMPMSGNYQVAWSNTLNFDGNPVQQFTSLGAQQWEPLITDPPSDLNFVVQGVKRPPGCGPCRRYFDIEPHFCLVELAELLRLVPAYADAGCTHGEIDTLVFDGGCPQVCSTDADCLYGYFGTCTSDADCNPPLSGVNARCGPGIPCTCLDRGLGLFCTGTGQCLAGAQPVTGEALCCDLVELSEVLALIDMYNNRENNGEGTGGEVCAHWCPPGRCDLTDDPNTPTPNDACCRDGYIFGGFPFVSQGTSETDCAVLGGTYFGDNTTCAGSALPPCCSDFPGPPCPTR